MKKILLFSLLIIGLLAFKTTEKSDFSILGKWEGIDKKEIGYFTFQEDGYVFIEMVEKKIGGKEFEMEGKKASMVYTIDYSTKPIQLDFILTLLDTKETHKILGIINVISENEIQIAIDFNNIRPQNFDTKNRSLTFNRVN